MVAVETTVKLGNLQIGYASCWKYTESYNLLILIDI